MSPTLVIFRNYPLLESSGVKNICDALQACRDIDPTAEKLERSRAYIYQQLGKHGMRPREVVQGK